MSLGRTVMPHLFDGRSGTASAPPKHACTPAQAQVMDTDRFTVDVSRGTEE
ncbi:hypothetical protein [Streptomyces sp. SID8352]|uniref:hypothetical protein n=1 Tax=Streptomyces sp. SID8352 TaxID=2690338 RepID=UPI00136FFF53|nr:hypothetical protein [Streptomyces sp. SID8352]MYU26298.1 hypothetical protein [Streptomyces sp. SID8352]